MQQANFKIHPSLLPRLALYLAGVVLLGLGIVFCVKCEMGVSPLNSIPFVLSTLMPLSLGTISIFFYLANISIQLLLSGRTRNVAAFLQLPVALLLGLVIDFWNGFLPSAAGIAARIAFLGASLFFTAFGIMLIVTAHMPPDPPTGTIQAISRILGKNMGSVKVIYDSSCVIIAQLISLCAAKKLTGFGIATLASAFLVGRLLAIFQASIGEQLKRRFPET